MLAGLGLHGRLRQRRAGLGRSEHLVEQLVVQVVAVGQHHERSGSPSPDAASSSRRRTASPATCPSPACARPRQPARHPRPPRPCESTALLTAQYWWYFATFFTRPSLPRRRTRRSCAPGRAARAGCEHALDQHLDLRQPFRREAVAVDRLPRRVVLPPAVNDAPPAPACRRRSPSPGSR